jgi:hypothetical protein
MGKQQYAVFVLFALIIASSLTSYGCYSCMSRLVNEDMDRALALTMQEQQSDVICQDTIHTFNSHLQIADLRGKATLAVETRGKCFKAYAHCSEATIFGLSDQRPAMLLWTMSFLWALFMWYKRQQGKANLQPLTVEQDEFGGLRYSEADDQFLAADGQAVDLTPMQHQLMEMFFQSPTYSLTKKEICDALWPKKPDASDTLYTLIRRLKPVIEQHSQLKIESNRGKAYQLKIK